MNSEPNNCIYLDPSSGYQLKYSQLEDKLAEFQQVPDVVEGEDVGDVLVKLLAAIVHNRDIALLPPGMSRGEARREIEKSPNKQQSQLPKEEGAGNALLGNSGANRFPLPDAQESPHLTGQATEIQTPKLRSLPVGLADMHASKCKIGIFTSGTTGRPKLVWHSILSLTRGVRVGAKHEQDVWGLTYHPAHFAGLQVALQAILNGNPLIRLFGLSQDEIHAAIDEYAITHISATPTFFKLLSAADRSHPGVRSVTLGGERMPESFQDSLQNIFPRAQIRNIYASTEVGSLLVGQGAEFQVPERLADQIRIMDGELAVHRSLLADSLQAATLPVEYSDEFFRTGDLVEVTCQSPLRFTIVSRRSDWINVGGYKVDPHKVENLIAAEASVAEARVFGQPNSVTGHIVCCEVVPRDAASFDIQTLKRKLRQQLERHEVPQVFQIVSELRTTSTGKKQRGRDNR